MDRKGILVIVSILLAAALVGGWYFSNSPKKRSLSPSPNTDTKGRQGMDPAHTEPQFTKEGNLCFVGEKGDTIQKIDIEVASNDAERQQGLMYRHSIPNQTGMLFIFDRPEMQSFWMKNTPSSLDIIFISPDRKILNIHQYTTPYAETNYPSSAESNLVLEVQGGWCTQHNIKPGDRIAYTLLYM